MTNAARKSPGASFGMVLTWVGLSPSPLITKKPNAMTKLHATNFGISLLFIAAFYAFILLISGFPI